MNSRGRLIILSGSSGSGKSTIINKIISQRPNYVYSVSSTTRAPRRFEIEKVHYYFKTRHEFMDGVRNNQFLEWEEVHDDLYGTERESIERNLKQGKHVLLDIDVHGGESVRKMFPDSILIFISPPSVTVLRNRLKARGTNTDEQIERRLARFPLESEKGKNYDYHVVNENLDETVAQILKIIESAELQYSKVAE